MGNVDHNLIVQYINNNKKIPKEMLFEMMHSDNLEEQGMAFQIFDQFASNIEEMPAQEDILEFYLNYFQSCMLENRNGDFVESCYMTAVSFVSFYKKLCSDKIISKEQLKAFRNMLKYVYLTGNSKTQDCVINGALEHLFEYPEIISDFKDWKEDNKLSKAYFTAIEFHGNSG